MRANLDGAIPPANPARRNGAGPDGVTECRIGAHVRSSRGTAAHPPQRTGAEERSAQAGLISIRLVGFAASGGFGTVTLSTPLVNSAVTSSGLGENGSCSVRTNEP